MVCLNATGVSPLFIREIWGERNPLPNAAPSSLDPLKLKPSRLSLVAHLRLPCASLAWPHFHCLHLPERALCHLNPQLLPQPQTLHIMLLFLSGLTRDLEIPTVSMAAHYTEVTHPLYPTYLRVDSKHDQRRSSHLISAIKSRDHYRIVMWSVHGQSRYKCMISQVISACTLT